MKWLSPRRVRQHTRSNRQAPRARQARPWLEVLESRLVPASIVWVNRGVTCNWDVNGDGAVNTADDLRADQLGVSCDRDVTGDGVPEAADHFGSTFGTRAEDARRVVDAAIRHWERVIHSFNY